MSSGDGMVDLSGALEALRSELELAWAASQERRIRFRVADVTLTVQVVARKERDLGGKIRWWLIEAGAGGKSAAQTTQTLVLTLTPSIHDEGGEAAPLDVRGRRQTEPAG
jgi:NTP-dependent ternary system trypsin peptidase co-occuring protein